MDYEVVDLGEINIAGISIRTTNRDGKSKKDIESLWKEWNSSDDIGSMIDNKISDKLYFVYTQYSSDFMGEYTVIIGYEVSTFDGLPEEFTKIKINPYKYMKYSYTGKIPDVVLKKWQEIWNASDKNRSYTTDFDVYSGSDPQNMNIETYVALRK